ncbi:NADP-dependent oxidoreductase domain-containing protein [Xylariomycetidae sp. FL2044]|nr:NADP-dependent oxidoreductase domain-containing protein [Xylariomycetidae sp. FL2044]
MPPKIIFGTATFGMDMSEFQDAQAVKELLQTLLDLGVDHLDTGARYPPLRPGFSEQLIGEAREVSSRFTVDTKVLTDVRTDGSGDLSLESIQKSTEASIGRLQRPEGVHTLYIHRSDPATPLEEQVRGFHEQLTQKHCKNWGVSNMAPETLEAMLHVCEQHGWPKPTYYQGTYNLISRGMETRLLPLLRAHDMKFVAFWYALL